MAEKQIFIGTYTKTLTDIDGSDLHSRGQGLYLTSVDSETGQLSEALLLDACDSPSFLCFGKDGKNLYAVNETEDYEGESSGAVSAYSIVNDGKKTTLRLLNQKATQGANPCHIVTSPCGNFILVSNYSGGNLTVYPIVEDGLLGDAIQHIQHQGSSVHPERQDAAYVHSMTFSKDGRFVYAADLGTDELVCYRFDPTAEMILTEVPSSSFSAKGGSGPRHVTVSADGQIFYMLNELNHSINVLKQDVESGDLQELQTISTLAEKDSAVFNTCADIHLTPDGKLLYASNRYHDSLVYYAVNQTDGTLTLLGIQAVGRVPRSFLIDEQGRYLVCSEQESDRIVSYAIDAETGTLTKVDEISVGSPVCVKMF